MSAHHQLLSELIEALDDESGATNRLDPHVTRDVLRREFAPEELLDDVVPALQAQKWPLSLSRGVLRSSVPNTDLAALLTDPTPLFQRLALYHQRGCLVKPTMRAVLRCTDALDKGWLREMLARHPDMAQVFASVQRECFRGRSLRDGLSCVVRLPQGELQLSFEQTQGGGDGDDEVEAETEVVTNEAESE